MRFITCVVIFAAICALVVAYPDPSEQEEISADEAIQGINLVSSHRFKRATCDIVPGIIKDIGHAACAAHCVTKGYRGGWCDSRAVCNCRR